MKNNFGILLPRRGAAVALMMALFLFVDLSGVKGAVLKYLAFTLAALLAGCGVKWQRSTAPRGYTLYATALMLILTVVISYLFPASSKAGEIDLFGVVCIAVLSPFFEELFFRAGLISFDRPLLSLFLSAAVFASFHSPDSFVQTFLLGIALSYFYISSKSITVPFVCHCANNILALICLGYDIHIPVLIVSLITAAVYFGVKHEKKVL